MTEKQEQSFLGKLVSVVVLLAAALYFTGWIYRWAYFNFFHVDIISLNFPVESFYIAAFQALLGSSLRVFTTAAFFMLTTGVILLSLQIIHEIVRRIPNRLPFRLNSIQFDSIRFLRSLVDEVVIVLWVLAVLFHLAQCRGDADARSDAINETSTLPRITFVSSVNNAPIGIKPDPDKPPNIDNFYIIGDLKLYSNLLTKSLPDISDFDDSIVWRLLLDGSSYIYIFPATSKKEADSDPRLRPPVLVIYKSSSGDQMLILSPPSE